VVRSIGAGDQTALRELYGRMHHLVFTVILRIVQSRETAEELTLDVFHDVWRRARTYDAHGGTVIGWILNQARSRAIDRVRFDQRQKRTAPPEEGADVLPTADSAEERVDADLRAQRVRDALRHLTAEERQSIEIAYFAGRTYAEVAEQLDEPPGTIKTRIRSGLIKLRHRLAGEERS
jgi:RNA polymerase sigma-70 factor (ECF subfamily)